MSLAEYKRKRSFSRTPEPEGKNNRPRGRAARKKQALQFVVQKHHASHLHYDFRLELKGALKSWAVPKGPSMNPDDKRLAMLVEDHPFDYKDFEGVIPRGNYGAGTVIIWDQGTYEPAEEAATKEEQEKLLLKGFYSGTLKIKLKGKKLKGEFVLVRSEGRGDNAWLLIKKKDEAASREDITKKDKSVVSNKNLEQVAADKRSKQWISNRDSGGKLKEERKEKEVRKKAKEEPVEQTAEELPAASPDIDSKDFDELVVSILTGLKGKKRSKMPQNVTPMMATLIDEPFDKPDWIYEVKWDGYRALAYLDKGKVELKSRNNSSFNEKFYPVYEALKEWPIKAVVDGEIVVVDENGVSAFSKLEEWKTVEDGHLEFYVFDILWLNGIDLTKQPLIKRREILQQLVPENEIIRYSESFAANGKEFFASAEKLGIEGIVAKKADSTYQAGVRSREWYKIKTQQRHEAVIAGYTKNEGSDKQFSALILGVYDENNELKFIGQAGTGFNKKTQTDLLKKLRPLQTNKCPFKEEPEINRPTRFRPNPPQTEVFWVKPQLVCEVKYQEMKPEGIMRHASFQGLREDKQPAEVHDEKPQTVNEGSREKKLKNRLIKLTNLDKIYWPQEKLTKGDLLKYYEQVAPVMLRYMKDRPQSLNRHPNGIKGKNFFQKDVSGKVDEWLTRYYYENTTREGTKEFLVCTDEASLLYMANMGCIEMNPWHSRTAKPDNPDWCVIDLDPDTNSFDEVVAAANIIRKILDAVKVPSFPKTSGSTGMHIYIPLGAKYSYEQSKDLAELIVTLAHQQMRDFTSLERTPAKRKGKIYLDFLQNRPTQTLAAPYSARPKPGATVSTPLHWDEVKKGLRISDFTILNVPRRLKDEGDLFKGVLGRGIDLEKVLKKIGTVFG
ncbi:MAG TPA: DNA ligase D [Chitinophagaceae bacterium]|nr:DNA ligase D [Chitinophagaceae bacterium]